MEDVSGISWPTRRTPYGGEEKIVKNKKKNIKPIITFFVMTTLLTAGIYAWMFRAGGSLLVFACKMWTPAIAALLTSLIHKDAIRNYGWRLGKARFLGYSFLLPIAAAIIGYGLVWASGGADIFGDGVRNYRWARWLGLELPVPVVVGLLSKMSLGFLLTFVFVVGEEIGWSGFLTPKLLKVSSVPVTSLVVGVYWAIWHFPALVGGFYGYGTPLWVALPGFTLVIIAASFLRTVLRLKSGSLWVGAILHTSHNVYLMGIFHDLTVKEGYASYLVSETGVVTGVVYMIVAMLFWRNQMKKPSLGNALPTCELPER